MKEFMFLSQISSYFLTVNTLSQKLVMCVQNMCVRMYTNFLLFRDNLLKFVVGFCEL
jgi:hypothetical protein